MAKKANQRCDNNSPKDRMEISKDWLMATLTSTLLDGCLKLYATLRNI